MTAQEFRTRTRSFRDHTAIGALVGSCAAIGLVAGLLWVDARLDHRNATLVIVFTAILGPIALIILALVYSNRLARRLGLVCPHCGAFTSSSLRTAVLVHGRCKKCERSVFDQIAEPGTAPNGGPAPPLVNSGANEGPPSVS